MLPFYSHHPFSPDDLVSCFVEGRWSYPARTSPTSNLPTPNVTISSRSRPSCYLRSREGIIFLPPEPSINQSSLLSSGTPPCPSDMSHKPSDRSLNTIFLWAVSFARGFYDRSVSWFPLFLWMFPHWPFLLLCSCLLLPNVPRHSVLTDHRFFPIFSSGISCHLFNNALGEKGLTCIYPDLYLWNARLTGIDLLTQ